MNSLSSFKLRLLKLRSFWTNLSLSAKVSLALMVLLLLILPSAYILSMKGINLFGRASEIKNTPPPQRFKIEVEGGRVNATWQAPPESRATIVDYRFEYKPVGSQTWTVYDDGVSTATSASIDVSNVRNPLELQARVSAITTGGSVSVPSNEVVYFIGDWPKVTDYGATPNDDTDDTVALQRAIDDISDKKTREGKSGVLLVPPGRYHITKMLFMKSFVRFIGTPSKSIIEHVGTDPNAKTHILLGTAHPWAYGGQPLDYVGRKQTFTDYPVEEVVWNKNSSSITLKNAEDTQRLQTGEIICVRSKKYFQVGDYQQPDFVQFNRIRKIEGNNIQLADRALYTISDPEVCKIEGRSPFYSYVMGRDINWYAAQWVELSGLVFKGGDIGIGGGLCYGCFVKNIKFEDMPSPIIVNALVKNIFTNIDADYSGRAVEIKMSSSQSSFRNLNLKYRPTPCPPGDPKTDCTPENFWGVWPVDIGERSTDITFNNLKIDETGSKRYKALFSIGDAKNIRLLNSNMEVTGGANREAVLEIRGNYSLGDEDQLFPTENFWFENNSFDLKSPVRQLVLLGDRIKRQKAPWKISNILLKNNSWTGLPTTTEIGYNGRNQIKNWAIVNDKFENSVAKKIRVEEVCSSQAPKANSSNLTIDAIKSPTPCVEDPR